MTTTYSIKDGKVTVTTEIDIAELSYVSIGVCAVFLYVNKGNNIIFPFSSQDQANDFYEEISKLIEH